MYAYYYCMDTPATICFAFWSTLFLNIFWSRRMSPMQHQVVLPWMLYPHRYLHLLLLSGNEPPVDRLLLLSPAILLVMAIISSLLWRLSSGGVPLHSNPTDPVSLDRQRIFGSSQLWCLLPHLFRQRIVIVCRFSRHSSYTHRFFIVPTLIRQWIVSCYLTDFPSSSILATTGSLRFRRCSGVYRYVPSLTILLSSPVTSGGLRLRHSCGALAHWLRLRIVVVRCNTLIITLVVIFVIIFLIILGIIVIDNGTLLLSTRLPPRFHCQSHHSSDAGSLALYNGNIGLAVGCHFLLLLYVLRHFSHGGSSILFVVFWWRTCGGTCSEVDCCVLAHRSCSYFSK